MRLQQELLLTYQGIHGMDGVCHIRAYEQPGWRPVVIAGELTDNPGTFVRNAIEMVAAAIQSELYRDGREFRLIQHRPRDEFLAVEFEHRSVRENPRDPAHPTSITIITGPGGQETVQIDGPAKEGDFRDRRWSKIDASDSTPSRSSTHQQDLPMDAESVAVAHGG